MAALKPFELTALYDAVLTALPMMNTRTKQRASVLIISYGADTASDAALREVRSALVRSDAFVYAIAVDPPAKRAINEAVNMSALNEITGGSGGNTELAHQTSDLEAATARIADELNHQYVLGYYSHSRSMGAIAAFACASPIPNTACAPGADTSRHPAPDGQAEVSRLPSSGFSTGDASVRLAQRLIRGIIPSRRFLHRSVRRIERDDDRATLGSEMSHRHDRSAVGQYLKQLIVEPRRKILKTQVREHPRPPFESIAQLRRAALGFQRGMFGDENGSAVVKHGGSVGPGRLPYHKTAGRPNRDVTTTSPGRR